MRWRMQYISDVLYDKSQLNIWAIYLDIYIYPVYIYDKKKDFSQPRPTWFYRHETIFFLSNLESIHNAYIYTH